MSLETELLSIYSLISSLIRLSLSPKTTSDRALESSVLPTPVGPTKINVPIGLLGSFTFARARFIALATEFIAPSCPITRSRKSSSKLASFSLSLALMRVMGIFVHSATISAISSSPIEGVVQLRASSKLSSMRSISSRSVCIALRVTLACSTLPMLSLYSFSAISVSSFCSFSGKSCGV